MVAIGWGEIGAISSTDSDDHIKDCINSTYPDAKPGSRLSWAGQVIRFVKELSVGDAVATYSGETRLYHVGKVSSVSESLSSPVEGEERREFVRRVDWKYQVPRDALSLGTRNSLGSAMTLFKPSFAASRELLAYPERKDGNVPVDDPENEPIAESNQGNIFEDYIAKAEQFVEDQIAGLGWSQMQELVAGILRAMGYRTKVSSPGPDRGVDIFASPDGLGLAEPRIFVEVKHRAASIGAEQIRSFIGGRKQGDRCLYVSTGGFSREARYEADRSQVPVTLLAMPELRELLLDHYEILDSETRTLVPLKKVYWPIAE
jgi:restriction system protein